MKKLIIFLLVVCTLFPDTSAQRRHNKANELPAATSAEARASSFAEKERMALKTQAGGIPFRNIGPTVMSGRVTDIAVNPDRPQEFYVAYASGGLWYTNNNGTSFRPVTDDLPTLNVGDIAVDWQHGYIWLGSGENNSSRSSYAGTGVFVSRDKGESWSYAGLPDSHHIGRILLNPENPEHAIVAVMGHLYTPSQSRGIYVTYDGGKSWTQTLYVNPNCGAIDLVSIDQGGTHLFAAMWERSRTAWNFVEGGNGSGIWESIDRGETWQLITGDNSGFPSGIDCGRIGLSAYQGPKGQVLFAMVDNQKPRPTEANEEDDTLLQKEVFIDMTRATFLALDTLKIQEYLDEHGFPAEYSAIHVMEQVENEEIEPSALYDYLNDANSELFDTPVTGAEVYRLDGVSRKWTRTHEDYLDDVVYSYGYYFGLIRVHPSDPNQLYIAGVPIISSEDGGKTWKSIQGDNQHVDHHALWLNPRDPDHFISGNDGGINITWDGGQSYIKCNSPSVGQFYTVNVDEATPYRVYGGLQDNGVWVGPSDYQEGSSWHETGHYPYEMLMGGDGMQVAIDTRTNETVYTGYQFGHYYRIDRSHDEQHYIHPRHELGESPLRWNWQTPIHLSRHNRDILYMASNRFHRSLNAGESMITLSGDLTKGGMKGNVPFGTATSIDESPIQFGLLYVGTDDGKVWTSSNSGNDWTDISAGLPQNLWVSRVEASAHDENRIYVTLNGYRYDHFDAYVFVSNDRGKKWRRLGLDLPMEPVNVVLEDPFHESLLYVGTDHGLYLSMDGGAHCNIMNNQIPPVAVHDLVIQEREKELVVGTHGRSIYIADIGWLSACVGLNELTCFDVSPVKWNENWGTNWNQWVDPWEPTLRLSYFFPGANHSTIQVRIENEDGNTVHAHEIEAFTGLNSLELEPTIGEAFINELEEQALLSDNGKYYLKPGKYSITMIWNSQQAEVSMVIE